MVIYDEALTCIQETLDVADESVLTAFLVPGFYLFLVPAIRASYAGVRIKEDQIGFGGGVQRLLQPIIRGLLAATNLSGMINCVI